MEKEQAKTLYYKLVNYFDKKENDGIARAWAEYLPNQDFGMAKLATDYFLYQENSAFMPSISQFNSRLREIQMQHSIAEASKTDSSACGHCHGLTWVESGELSYIPCKQCRSVAYDRWVEGAYNSGVLMYQNELEGPTQSYMPPGKPQYLPQKPVSPERARQWNYHIKARTGFTFPEEIPEGFHVPVIVEESAPVAEEVVEQKIFREEDRSDRVYGYNEEKIPFIEPDESF